MKSNSHRIQCLMHGVLETCTGLQILHDHKTVCYESFTCIIYSKRLIPENRCYVNGKTNIYFQTSND